MLAFDLNQVDGSALFSAIKPSGNFTLTSVSGDVMASVVVTLLGQVFARWLSGSVTAARIHGPATSSSEGLVMATICAANSSVPCDSVTAMPGINLFEWTQSLPSGGLVLNSTLLLNGLLYLNISTILNKGGELRGQLSRPCNGSCSIPFVPRIASFQPSFLNSSFANCSFSVCFFPFVATPGFFQCIAIFCSSNSRSRIDGFFINIEFQQNFTLTAQSIYQISFDKFPPTFSRGIPLFVQALLYGTLGSSSLSPVYTFVLPVIPAVQILEVDTQFESIMIKAAYPFSLTGVEFFEAFFLNIRNVVSPPFLANITCF
ncbi:CHRD domain-containing protein [Runella sp.]|uniref:CHRD domain-containing protein n=1 Tax=Runella sp. TaxID=1960881 RepID=UPI003019ABA7